MRAPFCQLLSRAHIYRMCQICVTLQIRVGDVEGRHGIVPRSREAHEDANIDRTWSG